MSPVAWRSSSRSRATSAVEGWVSRAPEAAQALPVAALAAKNASGCRSGDPAGGSRSAPGQLIGTDPPIPRGSKLTRSNRARSSGG